jgi:hypothetical protein
MSYDPYAPRPINAITLGTLLRAQELCKEVEALTTIRHELCARPNAKGVHRAAQNLRKAIEAMLNPEGP